MVALRVHRQWMHVVSPRTAAFCRREFSGLPTPLQSFAALQTTLRVGSRPRAIPSQTEPPPGTSAERDRHCPPDMAAEFISPFVEPVPMAAVPQHLLPSLFGLPAHAMPASSSCVYYSDNASLPEKAANATRFVCISDTHTHTDQLKVPPGDVLIHAGDFTYTGATDEVEEFNEWLGKQPHKYKIVIAGNHDVTFDEEYYDPFGPRWRRFHRDYQDPKVVRALLTNCIYLQDSEVLVDGWRVWGSPWQPEFCDWAFNLPRGSKLKEKWDLIPDDIDVLITHGPPVRHGGTISRGVDVGCEDLMEAVLKLQPLVHVFGHVHEGYGVTYESGITFINASTCTHNYCADNPPCVFDLFKKKPLAQ